jgi:hypothetical protein
MHGGHCEFDDPGFAAAERDRDSKRKGGASAGGTKRKRKQPARVGKGAKRKITTSSPYLDLASKESGKDEASSSSDFSDCIESTSE